MAIEEVIYDQMAGDPDDPFGLKKKAASLKAKADPYGLRQKAEAIKGTSNAEQQPAFQIQISTPTFKSTPAKTGAKDFTYTQEPSQLGIYKLEGKAKAAHDSLKKELESNKDVKLGMIKHRSPLDKMGDQGAIIMSDMPRSRTDIDVNRLGLEEKPGKPKADIINEEQDIASVNEYIASDRNSASEFLNEVAKKYPDKEKEIQKNTYLLDAFNSAANDPNGNERVKKIEQNAKAIEKGDLVYDHKTQTLVKPESFFSSLFEGRKELNRLSDAYDSTKKMQENGNEAGIIKELNAKMQRDPDEAVPTPTGFWGEAGHMLGSQPIKGLAAGAVAAAGVTLTGNPEAAGGAFQLASGAMNAVDMYKIGYQNALEQNYARIKQENPEMPDYEAYKKADSLADKQAVADAAMAGAMQYFGAKVGLGAAKHLQKGLSSGLSQIKDELGKKAFESLGIGGIGAAGQTVKNILAQKEGLNVETTEGVLDMFKSGVMMTGAMAMLGMAYNQLKPSTRNRLTYGLSQMPEDVISNNLDKLEQTGKLTPEQAAKVKSAINEQRAFEQLIPNDLPETDRLKIGAKIKERADLKQKIEQVDEAFHPEIKEKIKKINEDIISLSKGEKRGELQSLVLKAIDDEEVKGFAIDVLKNAGEGELKKYMKEIAEQANDSNSAGVTIETFGERIVNKAKELYPKEEPKESKISVIQPGEIKQPETITISPREQPASVPSTERVSIIMPKTKEDAIRQQITNEMDVRQQAGDGEALVTRDVQSEIPAGEEGQQRPTEESIPPSKEGQVSEPEMMGITHAQMDKVSRELGLPEYTKDPETFEGWTREAKDRLAKDPDSMNRLINRLRNGDIPDAVETQMMKMHFAALKDRYNKNPTPELLNEINRTKDLYNIAGREEGKRLVARRGSVPEEDTLADFHLRDIEYNKGARLTEEQLAQSTKEYNALKAIKDALEGKAAKAEADAAKLKAEKVVQQELKAAKKDAKKDYKAERAQIIKDIAEKWKKSSKESLGASVLPFAKELAAIAPDVMRLVRNVVEEGIIELGDVIKSVHAQVKDVLPAISEKNVHDIIAGEYTKKQTRNQLAATLYELKKEAQLMNELDQLLSGVAPTNEKRLRQRNQKIEALRQQIKELKDDMGLNERTMEEKLASLKGRYKTKIKELEKKIADGDFGPDEKPEPIQLDKEGQALRDEYLRLKEEREIRLLEQEYGNRGMAEKVGTEISRAIKTGRTLQSSFDVSYPFRQTVVGLSRQLFALPFKKRNGKWEYTAFEQQKQLKDQFAKMYQAFGSERMFRRIMDDIHNNPDYEKWQKVGLDLTEPVSALETAKEEMFQSSYAEKIPGVKMGVKASHRAATTIANKMKWDIVNQLAEKFQDQGKTFENSPELYEATAKYANQLIGRGVLGQKMENAAPVIAHFVYSLRLYASRLQLLTYLANPRFYTKVPKEIRVEYLRDMTKFVALGGTVMGLAAASGLKVGLNPFGSDFGSIVAGDTRYDIWGGFKQYAVLLSRLIAGKTMSTSGEVKDLRPLFTEDDGDYKEKTRGDVLLRFLRTKASPELSTTINIITGKGFDNKPVTVKSAALDYFTPLIYKDIQESLKDGGVDNALLNFLLASHGVGVQTYGSDEKKTSSSRSGKPSKNTKATKQSKN